MDFDTPVIAGRKPSDVEKHGKYDRDTSSYNRRASTIERIGKKYQWIALYEMVARVSDNFKKYERWNRHIDIDSDYGKKIHGYAKKNPKSSIIVQDDKTGHMVYLKKYSQLEK